MSDNFWLVLAVVLYFGVMVAIGIYSWRKTTKYRTTASTSQKLSDMLPHILVRCGRL